jgi:DDE superfamily endonuclease
VELTTEQRQELSHMISTGKAAAREDYEYEREGVCNVFLACEPLAGKCYTMVAAQRTRHEWAQFIRSLSDEFYPQAEKIVLVMDDLNTHPPRQAVLIPSFFDLQSGPL